MSTDLLAEKIQKLKGGARVVMPAAVEPVSAAADAGTAPAGAGQGATFEIAGVNGIAELTVSLVPGVNVALGPNGAGKSSAIAAILSAAGDKDAKAEPSDGAAKGEVRGGGGEVLLAVGNRRRHGGEPGVRLVSTGSIGQLIDPGIKDSDLAAKARIKALLSLFPLPADEAARFELTANDEELQRWIMGDPSANAAELEVAVRRKANEIACECEKESAAAEGEAQSMEGLIHGLGTLDFEAGDLKAAEDEARRLTQEAAVMAQTAQARLKLETQKREIQATMGEVPDVEAAQAKFDAIYRKVLEMQAATKLLDAEWAAAGREVQAAKAAAHQQGQRAEILKRPVEGPTPEEAIAARELAEASIERVERARKVESARQYLTALEAAKQRGEQKAARAKALRDIAQGTASALGRLLERRGLPGLCIMDGRIAVMNGEKVKDFDTRLSFGERVRTALGIALAGMGGMTNDQGPMSNDGKLPVLALEPEFWLALDETHRAEVNQIARERGVCLITEEPGDGILRVETMNRKETK